MGLRTSSTEHFDRLTEENIPLVYFDRVPKETACSTIVLDNRKAMKQVVDRLVKMGKRKIAYISYDGHTKIFEDRLTAYFQSVCEAGLSYENVFLPSRYSLLMVIKRLQPYSVLQNDPTRLSVSTTRLPLESLNISKNMAFLFRVRLLLWDLMTIPWG